MAFGRLRQTLCVKLSFCTHILRYLCHRSLSFEITFTKFPLIRKDRQGRRGGGVALYVKECFEVTELMTGDNNVESLWVKIRGRADKADILVDVCLDRRNRMKRQMRCSTCSWQKVRDCQPFSSWGTSTSPTYAGNTI